MGKISIQDLGGVLVERHKLSKKDASGFVSAMFDIIQQELEKDKIVKVKGLGTFKIIDVDDRESVNVNTGERVLIEGHGKITFTPDALMKELVNKPFSQFETVVLNDGVDFENTTESEVPEPELLDSEKAEHDDEPSTLPLVDFGDSIEEPAIEEPVKEEPIIETPVVEEIPVAEESVEDEPIVDEPVADESVAKVDIQQEQPVEEPVNDFVGTLVDEPTSESVEEPVDESVDVEDNTEMDDVETDDEEAGQWKWLMWVLACACCLAFGYLLGNYFPFSSVQESKPVIVEQKKEQPVKPEQKDTVLPAKTTPTAPATDAPATDVPAATATSATLPVTATSTDLHDQYAAKDVRVRLGAYRIVGTDKVVKVREGETLAKISRRYFGPDMECYVEVYNDLTSSSELNVGQEIKIPKLEHKKKKTAQTNN